MEKDYERGERWERKGGIQGWIERKGKGAERENESNGEGGRERERESVLLELNPIVYCLNLILS